MRFRRSYLSRAVKRLDFLLRLRRLSAATRIIVSAGMPRSGSTWLFNAARLLLATTQQEGSALSSGWINDWKQLPQKDILLLKVHTFDKALVRRSSLVLYSYRDVRDAIASTYRKSGITPSMKQARQFLRQDGRWRRNADFVMRYEAMLKDPGAVLNDLAIALGLEQLSDTDVAALLDRLNNLEQPAAGQKYHPETLVHHRHVTDGGHGSWQQILGTELTDQIERRFRSWFLQNEYPVS